MYLHSYIQYDIFESLQNFLLVGAPLTGKAAKPIIGCMYHSAAAANVSLMLDR